MKLIDEETNTWYIPVSAELVAELDGKWSEPVQMKIEDGHLVMRSLHESMAYHVGL